MISPSISTNTSAMRNNRTLTMKDRAIAGKDSRNTAALKNLSLTSAHPGERTARIAIVVKTTIVLATAIVTPFAP